MVCYARQPERQDVHPEPSSTWLAKVAARARLLVITDEIYEYFRYDGATHISPATVPGLGDRTVTIMGLSKTFSITGWRSGTPSPGAELAQPIALVNDIYYVCAPTPLQLGAAAGLPRPPSYFDELRDAATRRSATRFATALEKARLPPVVPEGAYYVLANLARIGLRSRGPRRMALLERAKVASIPGTAFFHGAAGDRFLRFCFAKEDNVLAEACRRNASVAL